MMAYNLVQVKYKIKQPTNLGIFSRITKSVLLKRAKNNEIKGFKKKM